MSDARGVLAGMLFVMKDRMKLGMWNVDFIAIWVVAGKRERAQGCYGIPSFMVIVRCSA
jgi:hypothetical protein